MISLRQRFRGLFDDRVQKRGIELFNLGRVTRGEPKGSIIEYQVKDRDSFRIKLNLENPKNSSCTCKDYEEGLWCRHIWACVVDQDDKRMNVVDAATLRRSDVRSEGRSQRPESKITPPETPLSLTPDSQSVATTAREEIIHQFHEMQKSEWLEKLQIALRKESQSIASRFEQRTLFILNLQKSKEVGKLFVEPWIQEKLPNGQWGAIRSSLLLQNDSQLQPLVARPLLRDLSQQGLLYYQSTQKNRFLEPLEFQEDTIGLKIAVSQIDGQYFARAVLSLPQSQHELTEIDEFFSNYVIIRNKIYEISFKEDLALYELFRKERALEIPNSEFEQFLNLFLIDHKNIDLKLPPNLEFAELKVPPKVRLAVIQQDTKSQYVINFDLVYDDKVFEITEDGQWIYDLDHRKKYHRHLDQEQFLWSEIRRAGLLGSNKIKNLNQTTLNQDAFLDCLEVAAEHNWTVSINQKLLKKGVNYSAKLKSKTEWFEMEGRFNFGNEHIDLPTLLKALRRDQRVVTLNSGEMAFIPKAWVHKFKMMARLGQESEEGLRISKVQALFLSSFFVDDRSFFIEDNANNLEHVIDSVKQLPEAEPSSSFSGDLRAYQKKGLSWLELLQEQDIGGILADDMGLGKTVMVLAALSKEGKEKSTHYRSLIVSPKTLVFNWISEAKKFTPSLDFIEYTGPKRKELLANATQDSVIVTTYHTLRQDIDDFKDKTFQFLVMDEAHYIKNADSQSYMACRMLQAEHKFALTGTPIENSIQDLFSLLSVVNPGLITDSSAQRIEKDPEAIKVLARALQPFVLRRTKEQVLTELPDKVEQIVYCELSQEERKKYDELKNFYWQQISHGGGETGVNTNRIQVLEALLRLRQAACHQGLLDEKQKDFVSAKFECLLEHIETVLAEGKKALIFSQFTSLLGLFSRQLEARGIKFGYLDGKTKDRAEIVNEFQNNDELKLFLISLKAGGVGLNLTAAEFVFILDPWWNPAAENQAIDRAHRIGQEKTVFAYKIIARDTIEEKILELQKSKLELAKNVVGTDQSLLKNLSMDDLKYLFT